MTTLDVSYADIKQIAVRLEKTIGYVTMDRSVLLFVVDFPSGILYQSEIIIGSSDEDDFNLNVKLTSIAYDSLAEGVAEQAASYVFPRSSSKGSQLVTQIVHRGGLMYKPIGFYFTTNTSVPGSYWPKTVTTPVTNVLNNQQVEVSSIEHVVSLFSYTITDGTSSEIVSVASVDTTNNIVTFAQPLQNSYTNPQLSMDKVKVRVENGVSLVDYYVTSNHADERLRGEDIQGAVFKGSFLDKERMFSYVWHPYYGENVELVRLLDDVFVSAGEPLVIKAESTNTLDAGLVLRLSYHPIDITERVITTFVEIWRV